LLAGTSVEPAEQTRVGKLGCDLVARRDFDLEDHPQGGDAVGVIDMRRPARLGRVVANLGLFLPVVGVLTVASIWSAPGSVTSGSKVRFKFWSIHRV
jgi:hypothetical protein